MQREGLAFRRCCRLRILIRTGCGSRRANWACGGSGVMAGSAAISSTPEEPCEEQLAEGRWLKHSDLKTGGLSGRAGVLKDQNGKIYVGRARDLKTRLTSDGHEHSGIIRDPNTEVHTFELETSQISGGTVDETLRVAEEYFKRAMNTNVRGRTHPSFTGSPNGLNESIKISAQRYEAYINQHGFPPIGAPVSH